eukprot:951264-Prymnesium_polylepis.1
MKFAAVPEQALFRLAEDSGKWTEPNWDRNEDHKFRQAIKSYYADVDDQEDDDMGSNAGGVTPVPKKKGGTNSWFCFNAKNRERVKAELITGGTTLTGKELNAAIMKALGAEYKALSAVLMIDQTHLRCPTDAKKEYEDEAKAHNLKLAFGTTPTSAAFPASATTPAVAVAASDCAAALASAAPAMGAMDVDALKKPMTSRKAFDFFKEKKGKAIIAAFKEDAKAKDAKAIPKAAGWNPAVQ